MSGNHAGPRRDSIRRYRVWPRQDQQPAPQSLPVPLAEAPTQTMQAQRPVTAQAVVGTRADAFHLAAQHGTPTVIMPAVGVDAAPHAERERRMTPPPPPLPKQSLIPHPVVVSWMAAVAYPVPLESPERYARAMRQVSALTGTRSPLERASEWPRHALEMVPAPAAADAEPRPAGRPFAETIAAGTAEIHAVIAALMTRNRQRAEQARAGSGTAVAA